MFNELQLLLLQKEREQAFARELQAHAWRRSARQTQPKSHPDVLLKQTILRTLAIGLLVVMLALGLRSIASAQSTIVPANHAGDVSELVPLSRSPG